ncbi:MAG: hypothetical protein WC342_07350 [Methanoregula sp.]
MRRIFGLLLLFALLMAPAEAVNMTPVTMSVEGNMTMVSLTEENAGRLVVSPVQVIIMNVTTDESDGRTGAVIAYSLENLTGTESTVTVIATESGKDIYAVNVVTVKTGTFIPVNNLTFSTGSRHSAFFKETVKAGAQETWIDLAWPGSGSSLDLMVYAPDATLGPFNDTADGRADNRIFLDIAGEHNVTPGDWYFMVRNNGTDATPYTLNTYTS